MTERSLRLAFLIILDFTLSVLAFLLIILDFTLSVLAFRRLYACKPFFSHFSAVDKKLFSCAWKRLLGYEI